MKGRILAVAAGVLGAVVLVFAAAALGAAATSGAGAKHSTPVNWPEYGASAARGFYQPGESIVGRGNVAELKQVFLTVGGTNSNPPVLFDGVLYESACSFDDQTGNYNCMIAAQNATSGAVLWTHPVLRQSPTPDVLSVSAADGRVFVPFMNNKVEAIDAATGRSILWHVHLPLAAVPAVADGVVFAAGSDGMLYALSEATGARLWTVKLGPSIGQPPAVANGVVYAGSADGTLHALNAATGAQLWSAAVKGPLTAYPSVGDGMVFAAASNGSTSTIFYAFDAESGALRWQFAGSSSSQLQWAAVDPDNVYVVDNVPGTVHAFSARTGRKLWSVTPQGGGAGGTYEPVVANGVIYVGTNYAIHAYNTTTGASLASIALDTLDASCAFPQYSAGIAIANGVLYSDCQAWALPARR